MPELPAYDDLPVRPDAPAGSSWGVFGDDHLGALDLLTPERVREAAGLIRRGALFPVNWDMTLPDPPLFGRARFRHEVTDGGMSHDDVLHAWNTQSSSQWDGFRHIRSQEHGFYGGVADEEHGVHHWARRGLAGRAVLCDVARWREREGRPLRMDQPDPIEADDVRGALDAQGAVVRPGDVLLVHTGWTAWYEEQPAEARQAMAERFAAPGLRPGEGTARLLWDLHVAAAAADNPSLEVWPPGALATPEQRRAVQEDPARRMEIFVHTSLLPLLGIPIGELFDLAALARDCADDGVYEAFFCSAPLNLPSGVATTPNALAIK